MLKQLLLEEYKDLQTRLRTLILQNSAYVQDYDEKVLREFYKVSARLLTLKKELQHLSTATNEFIPPFGVRPQSH